MSSKYVRDTFKAFVAAGAPTEKLLDLTAQFQEIRDFLTSSGVTKPGPWLGINFIPGDEVPITVGSNTMHGKFRENGIIYLHVVAVASLGVSDSILTRAEALRDLLRNQRIGRILIESVSPPAFDTGATLQFDSGYMSGSFLISYICDLDT